jgi:hypothetical protein
MRAKLIDIFCVFAFAQMVLGVLGGSGRQVFSNILKRSISSVARSMEQNGVVPDVIPVAPTEVAEVRNHPFLQCLLFAI